MLKTNSFFVGVLIVITVNLYADAQRGVCGPNQSAPCQPDCERSCTNLVEEEGCRCRTICDKCLCIEGYVRDPSGACIKPADCPPPFPTCGPNESPDCQYPCEGTCEQPKGKPGCDEVMICDACLCVPGYVRNSTGSCIKLEDCPPVRGQCRRPNESSGCQPACEGTCQNPKGKKGCKKRIICDACLCVKGYVREYEGGPCIKLEDCPC